MTERRSSLAFRLFVGAAVWALVLLLLGAIALTTLYQRSVLGTLDDRLSGGLVRDVRVDGRGRRGTGARGGSSLRGRHLHGFVAHAGDPLPQPPCRQGRATNRRAAPRWTKL